jgi:hypothetical protein
MRSQALPLSVAVVAILSFLLVTGIPVAKADTLNSLTVAPSSCVSPSSCPPNTVVTITISATIDEDSQKSVQLIVVTPNGDVYMPKVSFSFMGGPIGSSTITCSVPFGGPGTLTSTATNAGSAAFCSGSNAAEWYQITNPTLSSEEMEKCNAGGTIISAGEGSTAQGGTYTVLGCFEDVSYIPTQFSITSAISGVPQFPLGLAALFAVMLPILLIFRTKRIIPSSVRNVV